MEVGPQDGGPRKVDPREADLEEVVHLSQKRSFQRDITEVSRLLFGASNGQ